MLSALAGLYGRWRMKRKEAHLFDVDENVAVKDVTSKVQTLLAQPFFAQHMIWVFFDEFF